MLHKKQKFTFSQARFVYQDRMGSHPGEDQSSQPKENLDQKYLSKFNREALYETAEETVTKARAILDTIQKEGKGNDGLQKKLQEKTDRLADRVQKAKAYEAKKDMFSSDAVVIHHFNDQLLKIMAGAENPPAPKTNPVIAVKAQPTPTEPKEEKGNPVTPPKKEEAPKAPQKVATKVAETGPKLDYKNPVDRQKTYKAAENALAKVAGSSDPEVKMYAGLLQKVLAKTQALELSSDTTGINNDAMTIDLAQKALLALSEGTATDIQKRTLARLQQNTPQASVKPAEKKSDTSAHVGLDAFTPKKESDSSMGIKLSEAGGPVETKKRSGLASVAGTEKSAAIDSGGGKTQSISAPKTAPAEQEDPTKEVEIPVTFLKDEALSKAYENFAKNKNVAGMEINFGGYHYRFVKEVPKVGSGDTVVTKTNIRIYRKQITPKAAA